MPINENLARVLRQVKAQRQWSMEELSAELGIAKSAAVEYLRGTGNPRADTLELLAEKCGVPIEELVSGPPPGWGRAETMARAACVLSALPPERREEGARLFLELAALFAEEERS